jgi:Flp pilus assembly pilin Flp
MKKLIRNRKGQGLVEYALIIAGVALIAAVGISLFGHKVSDMIDAVAVILPGAHTGDNGPIASGHLIETTDATAGGGPITIDTNAILNSPGTARLGENLFSDPANGMGGLIVETGGT